MIPSYSASMAGHPPREKLLLLLLPARRSVPSPFPGATNRQHLARQARRGREFAYVAQTRKALMNGNKPGPQLVQSIRASMARGSVVESCLPKPGNRGAVQQAPWGPADTPGPLLEALPSSCRKWAASHQTDTDALSLSSWGRLVCRLQRAARCCLPRSPPPGAGFPPPALKSNTDLT
ncbi:hypothetical protein JDV02_003238 [Purpureocillium takamizusanense]|uniref:Uncharacterized protein n=1 Tax=Purpureocillium takamizusanense TaxID=2060973 RepID=A0A9Q8QCQ5_9HYPO|nr:uncharacterized protein JDV02_003238 [Purpureocillium takamizusanense]UNI16842.1 hypothetical protein JDV02_003238 [Purpureocillium takamizusanense]